MNSLTKMSALEKAFNIMESLMSEKVFLKEKQEALLKSLDKMTQLAFTLNEKDKKRLSELKEAQWSQGEVFTLTKIIRRQEKDINEALELLDIPVKLTTLIKNSP